MYQFATLFCVILLPILPAFILFKALPSTGAVDGKLQGMEIKLGGAFAGYFAVVLLIIANQKTLIPLQYKQWTVTGQVVNANGPLNLPLGCENVSVDPAPLTTPVPPPGSFSLTYYSNSTATEGISPILSIAPDGYQSVCYSLDPTLTPVQGCLSNVTVTGNTINLGKVLVTQSSPYPDNLAPITPVSASPGADPGGPHAEKE